MFKFSKNTLKVKPFTVKEIFVFGALLLSNLFIIYYLLGNYIIKANDYNIYLLNIFINGSNFIIQQQIYQFIVFSAFFSIIIPVNVYIISVSLNQKYRLKNSTYSISQILIRLVLVNSFLLFIFILVFVSGNNIVYRADYLYFNYYDINSGFISFTVFEPIIEIAFLGLILLFGAISFYTIKGYSNFKAGKGSFYESKTHWDLLKSNFLIYYFINMLITFFVFYWSGTPYINYVNEFFLMEIGLNLSIFFLKFLYDLNESHLTIKSLVTSLISNFLFFIVITINYFQIYQQRGISQSDFSGIYYNSLVSDNFFAYVWIGFFILIYIFRKQLYHYSKVVFSKTKCYAIFFLDTTLSVFKKVNPFSFLLYHITLRKLNNDDQAVFFTKKFIIIQSKHLKNALPGALPATIPEIIQNIFKNDIDRLQQLFKINNIKTYSNKAILKFVMNTANLIIKDLQKTLQEHLTEELLKETNDAKQLQVNVEELWQKANKVMIQWESTFTDAELKYKDTLLTK